MKNLIKSTLLLLCILMQFNIQAQCGGSVNVLPVNTGYNYVSNTASNIVSGLNYDARWNFINPNSSIISAFMVDHTNTFFPPQLVSTWISYDNNTGQGSAAGTKTYQFNFCLDQGFQLPSCTLNIQADDEFVLKFNGTLHSMFSSPTDYVEANIQGSPITVILDPNDFLPNQNKIEIIVNNLNPDPQVLTPTGLNVTGEVRTLGNTIQPYCKCLINGTIYGYVFEDYNANGVDDQGDEKLGGQVVELWDMNSSSTTPEATTTTVNGYYSFIPKTSNNYQVRCIPTQLPHMRRINYPLGTNYHPVKPQEFVEAGPFNFGLSRYYMKAIHTSPANCQFDANCATFNTEFQIVDNRDINVYYSSYGTISDPNGTFTDIFKNINYVVDYNIAGGVAMKYPTVSTDIPNAGNVEHTYPTPYYANYGSYTGVDVSSALTILDDGYNKLGFIRYDGERIDFNSNFGINSIRLLADNLPLDDCCPSMDFTACTNMLMGHEYFEFTLNGRPNCPSSTPYNIQNGTLPCCINTVTWSFIDPSPLGGGSAVTLATSNLLKPTYNFPSVGNYQVRCEITLINNPTCVIDETWNVTVSNNNPTITSSTSDCINPSVDLDYTSAGLTINDVRWDFGDNSGFSTQMGPVSHVYAAANTYTVNLRLNTNNSTTPCYIYLSKSITVDEITGTIDELGSHCDESSVSIDYNFNSTASLSPTKVIWDFGDGSSTISQIGAGITQNLSHIYDIVDIDPDPSENFTVSIQLIFPTACTLTVTKPIEIVREITSEVEIQSLDQICLGDPTQLGLTGDLDYVNTIAWTFGNGENSNKSNPLVYYTAANSYTVNVDVDYTLTCVSNANAQKVITIGEYDNCASCEECIPSFAPMAGKEYVLSAWVKEGNAFSKLNYSNSGVSFFFEGSNIQSEVYKAKGPIIEGWQQVEESFTIPEGTTAIQIELVNEGTAEAAFFDDIRIYPFNANLKSFVYDPIHMRLTAELDENNYATFYEYDEDGNLIRLKKETDRGIKTIQENRKRTKQEP